MSSTKKASPMRGFAGAVAVLLPLVCAATAHAGESARESAAAGPAPVRMEAGDALGLEIFARELPQTEPVARTARPERAAPQADRRVVEEPVPAAPDLSAPASR